jgi:hypothetical protein
MGVEQQPQHYPVVVGSEMHQQPLQQNVYFQPPQVAYPNQYLPQPNYSQEAPVLQASSNMYPQPAVAHHYPQPMPQQYQPQIVAEPQPEQAPRCGRFRERVREAISSLDAYRVAAFATTFSTLAYFLFTPHAWPWFLLVAALSVGFCGSKFIKTKFDMTERQPHFYIHALWYGALNIFWILTNLWSAGYPWSVFPLCLWGIGLGLHALKLYNTNSIKTRLYIHFIIYLAVVIIILVTCTRGYRAKPLIPLIVIAVWSLILTFHARRVRKFEERQSEASQNPAELEVVSTQVPNQANEAENAQLVQNQQEVYTSIHQAQLEQRAQQAPQVHLFQQPPQSNIYPANN